MKRTHTQGPWKVTDEGSQIVIQTFAPHPTGTLARVYRTDKRAHADAQVIAAAPDLLAALEAIAKQADFSALAFPNVTGRGDLLAISQMAGDAIAMATGKGGA